MQRLTRAAPATISMTSWPTFLQEQQAAGFPAFAGAQASVTLPISDTFATAIISEALRSSATVRRISIEARAGNTLHVRASLTKLPFLPDIPVDVRIERQPEFPASPTLALRIQSIAGLPGGIAFLLQFVKEVPEELSIQGTLVAIDLRAVARRFGREDLLRHITRLEVTTVEGAIVVAVDGGIPREPEPA